MQSTAKDSEEYLESLPEVRKQAVGKLRKTLLENLPEGFEEEMAYGMLSYSPFHVPSRVSC